MVLVLFILLFVILGGASVEIAGSFGVSITLKLGELNNGNGNKKG